MNLKITEQVAAEYVQGATMDETGAGWEILKLAGYRLGMAGPDLVPVVVRARAIVRGIQRGVVSVSEKGGVTCAL